MFELSVGDVLVKSGGSVKTGPFGTKLSASEYSLVGAPVISVGEVGYGGLRVTERTKRVGDDVIERLPEYLLAPGDIVFGRKGAVDRSAWVKPSEGGYFLGSDGIRLRFGAGVDSRFMAYQFQSPRVRNWVLQHAVGTTLASLNEPTLKAVPVRLPPLWEQRAIAATLGALDDKIESNRRAIATTRSLMIAHWESAEKQWLKASLVLTPVLGGTPKRSVQEFWSGGVKWASAKDVAGAAGGFILETEETVSELGIENSAAKVLPTGTVVMTARGTVGALARLAEPMAFNQSCYGLVSHEIPPATLLVALQAAVSRIRDAGHGTVFNTVNMATFDQIELELPMAGTVQDLLEGLSAVELQLLRESRALERVRDALLPELLSGRTRVPEARDAVVDLVPETEVA